jgi:hypothetical protein
MGWSCWVDAKTYWTHTPIFFAKSQWYVLWFVPRVAYHSFPLRISNPFSKLITVSWIRFDHLLNILPKFIIEDIFIHEHTDLDSRRSSFWTRDSFCLRTLSSRIYFEKNKHGKSMQELIKKGFNFNFNGQILIQKPLKSGRKKMIDFHVFNLLLRVG